MFAALLEAARTFWPTLIAALVFEALNIIALVLFFMGLAVDESTLTSAILEIGTAFTIDAADLLEFGLGLSFIFSIAAYICFAIWFFALGKLTGPHGLAKFLWSMAYFIGSIFIPLCILGGVVMIEYYALKGALFGNKKAQKS